MGLYRTTGGGRGEKDNWDFVLGKVTWNNTTFSSIRCKCTHKVDASGCFIAESHLGPLK